MAEVERFGWVLGADGEHGGIDRREDGGFVRLSDYEKEKERADTQEMVAVEGGEVVADLRQALEKVEADRDSLRSQLEAEAKRLRSEDFRLRRLLPSQSEFLRFEAYRLQAILDSTSTEGEGSC